MLIFFITLVILLLLIAVFLIAMLAIISSFFVDAPFVPMRKVTLGYIVEALKLKEGSILYDLGCGDGRVLRAAISGRKGIRGVGVEKGILPYLLAKFVTRRLPVKIFFKDIADTDIRSATHIFLYLGETLTQSTYAKIKKECKAGVRIVTCDFQINGVIPLETIALPHSLSHLSKKLFVYSL